MLNATAVVMEQPETLHLSRLDLEPPGSADVVVDTAFSGISTGTERLLWSGQMPAFPGMGYPLVPGYESVGRVRSVGPQAAFEPGDWVFVPGSRGFRGVRGLFGGAASRLVAPAERVVRIEESLAERGVLLALAATAYHALSACAARTPELIVGHGVLGRMLARLSLLRGGEPPTVWEQEGARIAPDLPYPVLTPADDTRRDYRSVYDVSGDAAMLDVLLSRLAPRSNAEIVLAGFYPGAVSFDFSAAFMSEARLRIAAEWDPHDLASVKALVERRELSLDGLITHREDARRADGAYRTAFEDPGCLKMILDWRECA